MSLILDALNRSKSSADQVPDLATYHPVESMPSRARLFLPWICLLLAILVIAWLVVTRFKEPSSPATDIGAPVAELTQNIGSAAASVTSELKARAAAQQVAQQPVASNNLSGSSGNSQPEAVNESSPGSPPVEPVTVPPPPSNEPASVPVKNAAVESLYQNRDALDEAVSPEALQETGMAKNTVKSATQEQPIDIEKALQLAREEMENVGVSDHPVPLLTSLSQRTKDDIPTLYYQRHDYSPEPSNSSVVLNGKTFKVGGSPLAGMKVEEILPDSIVLSYRGTQFRLRALNSWINL